MTPSVSAASRQLHHEEAGLSDLRRDALCHLLGILLATAFALLLADGAFIRLLGIEPAYVALTLAAVVAVTWRCLRWGVRRATGVLVVGLVGSVVLGVALFPSIPVFAVLCVPVLIAVVLLGVPYGAGVLVGGVVLSEAVALSSAAPNATETAVLTFGLGGLVLACSAVLWRAFDTVLDWSWSSYEQAQQHAAALRQRQSELGRLNQSLILAYEQLKQVTGQLERARRSAEEARRLKAEFAASVSHELRTPLNLIIGLAELMVVTPRADAPPLPSLYRADLEAIYRNACHISNLIDDVLDLSQIEAHRMGLLKEWVSLRDVVAHATATVQTLFENTGLTLRVCIPDDVPPLFVDPIRIRQILINLLNNAVRFTEEGEVTVSARRDGNHVVIEVADTGVGIPPEDLPGVFSEFWRSGEPRRGRRGSGLGLAVSRRFAELHGGNMWVTSERGRGSTFALALPIGETSVVADAELGRAVWHQIEQQAPVRPVVLLVDPDADTLRVFRRYLDGFSVIPCADVASVTRLTHSAPVCAVVVRSRAQRDLVRGALQRGANNSAGSRLPIITCALRTSSSLAADLGVLDYLVKPVGQPALRRALHRLGRAARDLLLVDDDPEMLHLLTRMIGALAPRAQVRVAASGEQAIELMRERPAQGILLDLLMPGLDGYGVLAQLRQTPGWESTPVVVITAHGTEDEGLLTDALEISQVGGIRAGEFLRWLRASIDIGRPVRLGGDEPAPPARHPASPASGGSHEHRASAPARDPAEPMR